MIKTPFVAIHVVVSVRVCMNPGLSPVLASFLAAVLLKCSYCWSCYIRVSLVENAMLSISHLLQLPDLVTCLLCLPSPARWTGVCVNDVMHWVGDLIHLKTSHFFHTHIHMPASKITQQSLDCAGLFFRLLYSNTGFPGCAGERCVRLKGRAAFGAAFRGLEKVRLILQ